MENSRYDIATNGTKKRDSFYEQLPVDRWPLVVFNEVICSFASDK